MYKVNLDKYNKMGYQPGNAIKRMLWYFTNIFLFKTSLPLPSSLKVNLLKLFGTKIGIAVVIKPTVNIKYPWFLEIGNHCWIGEGVWIDNLTKIVIGNHVILSQGAYLLTGSHDYKKTTFDLILGEITLKDGVWIGAKAIVSPGIKCNSHSVLTAGSVATSDLEPYSIYQGNPAQLKRKRIIT